MTNIYICLIIIFAILSPCHPQDTDHYLLYGDNHLLPCNIENPHINVTWYKDSIPISTLNLDGLSVSINGSLYLSDYVFAHTGHYVCGDAVSGFNLFVDCGLHAIESVITATITICVCKSGYFRYISAPSYTCSLCPIATYKPHPGDYECFSCPTSRVTLWLGRTHISECVCLPGEGTINSMDLCVPCPANYYQSEAAYTACVPCPLYSATPPAQGEADPEGFILKSDCICQFTQGNADNSTCYAYSTKAVVVISENTGTSLVVSFERQLYARAEDGSLQGTIDRYLIEVFASTSLVDYHGISDLTGLSTIHVNITGLLSGIEYKIVVTSFVSDMEGEPSVVHVTTLISSIKTSSTTTTTILPSTTTTINNNPNTTTSTTDKLSTTTPSSATVYLSSYGIVLSNITFLYLMAFQFYLDI